MLFLSTVLLAAKANIGPNCLGSSGLEVQGWRQGWLASVPQPWLHTRMPWALDSQVPSGEGLGTSIFSELPR